MAIDIGKDSPYTHLLKEKFALFSAPNNDLTAIGTGLNLSGYSFLSSDDLVFSERGTRKKTSILVAPSGRELMKNNNGLLHTIDEAMRAGVDLGSGEQWNSRDGLIKMTPIAHGRHSEAFKLTIDQSNYVLKIPEYPFFEDEGSRQPFIAEMSEVIEMRAFLGDFPSSCGLVFPEFVLATPFVSLTKYEEGDHPSLEKVKNFKMKTEIKVNEAIAKLKRNNPTLWKGIKPDYYAGANFEPKNDNFIERIDGTLVWIDPFYFSP